MGADQLKPKHAQSVIAPFWEYMGGAVYTPNGASVNVPVPSRATTFSIAANGGAVHYGINHGFADANSPGYVADGQRDMEVALANLTSLHVYTAAGTTKAHVQFYREV